MPAPDALPTRACDGCGSPVEDAWRHCAACGLKLVDDDLPEREHLVTMVVSDLQGSTALAETLDPESLRLVLDIYFDELGAVLESHGGRIEKRIGDMMVTAFGLPNAQPDDPVRALRAAAETQAALARLNEQLESGWGVRLTNRTGVATGNVVYATAGGGHRVLAGPGFEKAGALEPVAPALEVLVDPSTVELVGDAAEFAPLQGYTGKAGVEYHAHLLLSVTEGPEDDSAASTDGTCAGCGAVVEPAFEWCTSCGVPLGRRTRRQSSRRTLTIVFADLSLSHTREGVEAAAERSAMLRAFEGARATLERHGGTVEKFIGDAVMAVWGLERRNEDDALRAVRAALEVQESIAAMARELDRDLGVRVTAKIGVNTGPVIAGDPQSGERLVTGDAVNVAARLEQTAKPGAVVIGDLTRRLAGPGAVVEELAPLTLKGKAEPVPAFRVRRVEVVSSTSSRFELPLVGREDELDVLRAAWQRVVDERTWQRISVVGDAGIGKSRLVYHLLDQLRSEATMLRGTCLSYGEGITFWPIAEIIRAAADIPSGVGVTSARRAIEALTPDPEVAVRLQALLGLDDRPVPVSELFWAIRRLLAGLAARRPLVVVIDGVHWAEPVLLELLEDLTERPESLPIFFVTMERPSGEGSSTSGGTRIELGPLSEQASDDLITHALGSGVLPDALRQHIVRSSAGVPLFVEQLLTMLIDDGKLVHGPSGWHTTADIADLAVPPTIEALLAARVDALPDGERGALEPASVIGREFPRAAVEHLTDTPDLAPTLDSLVRRQLVAPHPAPDPSADHRFRNLLIRDVVYEGLLKRSRAVLHEQFARWLLHGPAAERVTEIEEILGYHFERAFLLGAEVAAVDQRTIEIGELAAEHLGSAGERAFARGDMPAAANLLQRAATALPRGGSRAARLLIRSGEASLETGAFGLAVAKFDDAEAIAIEQADECAAAAAELARVTLRYLTGDGVDDETARAAADRLQPVFERHDDHADIARCWRLRAYLELTRCQWGAAEEAALQIIEHARLGGDPVLEGRVLPALAGFALHGPTPAPEALVLCRELLERASIDRRARSLIDRSIAHLLALDGRFDEARDICAATRAQLSELGWNFDAALVSIDLGPIELMAGRPEAAEVELRADYETLRAMGEQNYRSTTTALLAEAVRRQGRPVEALALSEEAEALATEDDIATQAAWRAVRSQVHSARGEHEAAIARAREALDLLMATDGPRAQGDALVDLALILAQAGDDDGARAAMAQAIERFETKGARARVERAHELLAMVTEAG